MRSRHSPPGITRGWKPARDEATGPLLRNAPAEPGPSKQPGAGWAAVTPVAVTIRRSGPSAMQSGRARRTWILEFEATTAPGLDPLMGWTTQTDPLAGHEIAFHTAEAALAFARRQGWRPHIVGDGIADDPPKLRVPSGHGGHPRDEEREHRTPTSEAASWNLSRRSLESKK